MNLKIPFDSVHHAWAFNIYMSVQFSQINTLSETGGKYAYHLPS